LGVCWQAEYLRIGFEFLNKKEEKRKKEREKKNYIIWIVRNSHWKIITWNISTYKIAIFSLKRFLCSGKKKEKKKKKKQQKEIFTPSSFFCGLRSSLGTISIKKSKTSVLVIAIAISFL